VMNPAHPLPLTAVIDPTGENGITLNLLPYAIAQLDMRENRI
jgi:hypothetical protein